MGNNYTAMARGLSAIGVNPAGLGMPDSPGFSFTFLPISAQHALEPIGYEDFLDVEGTLLDATIKDAWLQENADAGGQSGGFGADVTGLAFTAGPLGFQVSTMVRGDVKLNPAGAELLLYGNAGKTGEPLDYNLEGSRVSALAISTVGVSLGFPLSVEGEDGAMSTFAIGATVKYSMGNALALGEDLGSEIRSDPLAVEITFPMIVTDSVDADRYDNGTGMGLDLGANWQQGAWTLGLAVQNLFHSFEFVLDDMRYIPGTMLWDQDTDAVDDFDPRSVEEAPAGLIEAVAELKFKPQVAVGVAYDATEKLTLTGDFHKRMGDGGIQVGPDLHLGVGLEFRGIPLLPIRLGAAKVTDGVQFAGGLTLALGPIKFSGAGALQQGDRDGALASFSLTFGGY
jgi:hypothetical protein